MKASKKVLILTYYWPPSGGSGVQRWMYFCRYLAEFGFEPIVVTVKEESASYKHVDPAFLERVKHVETHRTSTLEPLKMYSLLVSGSANKGIPQGHVGTDKKGFFHKLSTFVRGNFFVPDARMGWNRYALPEARKLIREHNIDLLITTGPPHSTHLMGLKLKKEFPIKWLADLRDPWTDLYYVKDLMRMDWANEKDARLERDVLLGADQVLTVGVKLKELLGQKIPGKEDKIHYIYNGFDSFLMDELKAEEHDHFQLSYTGLMSSNQPYTFMIEALKKAFSEVEKGKVKMVFAGNIEEAILEAFTRELPFMEMDFRGYVSHAEALVQMKSSQLLLNVLPEMKDSEILISGKLMEYMASGNPVLCIGNPVGEAAIMLREVDNARLYAKDKVEEMASFIRQVYDRWSAGNPMINNTDTDYIKSKSRYETSRQLADFLRDMGAQ
ncbi:glycosyltransferase [bacterium SCSIO 12741]|nr:glycosyltransferase [bacterium SCSIO 12741]